MKWMIASDIHGSARWCEAMLAAWRAQGAPRLVLLGDLLYHGPRNDLPDGYAPKRVIELLTAVAPLLLCVRGNCEAEVDQMVLRFPVMADYAVLADGERLIYCTHGQDRKSPAVRRRVRRLHRRLPAMVREPAGEEEGHCLRADQNMNNICE